MIQPHTVFDDQISINLTLVVGLNMLIVVHIRNFKNTFSFMVLEYKTYEPSKNVFKFKEKLNE